ncbi:MAG: glucose 1-dehydrogenase [Ectothiorhodospiraceae bacterium]|nr:glucose 1-dehydrogenase [Ectothiorhodospiraceae bacterium]
MSTPRPRAALEVDLTDRVALVTGAGRGIGRACARGLAACGAEVVAMSRTAAELDQLVAEIEREGGRATALPCDVTDRAAVRTAIEGLDRLDILVNNAGINRPQPFLEVTDDALDLMLDLNVRAAFVVAQSAARVMVRGGGGAIVNMTSQMGRVGAPLRTVYCATKHALEGLTRAMAVELAPQGVRVNAVAPTFVETPLTRTFFADDAFRQWVLARIPQGRIASADEVVGAVLFLASPAASLITGTSLAVDGGWTAQ